MSEEYFSQPIPDEAPGEKLNISEGGENKALLQKIDAAQSIVGDGYANRIRNAVLEKMAPKMAVLMITLALTACGSPQNKEDTNSIPTVSEAPTTQVMAAENPASPPAEVHTSQAVATETGTEKFVPNAPADQDVAPEQEPNPDPEPHSEALSQSEPYTIVGDWSTEGEWAQLVEAFEKLSADGELDRLIEEFKILYPELDVGGLIVAQGKGFAPKDKSGSQVEYFATKGAEGVAGAKLMASLPGSETTKSADGTHIQTVGTLRGARTVVKHYANGAANVIVVAPAQQ